MRCGSQNAQLPIVKVASNPYGRGILWPWLKDNWKSLESKIGHGNPLFGRIVSSIAMAADGSETDEIKKFFIANRCLAPSAHKPRCWRWSPYIPTLDGERRRIRPAAEDVVAGRIRVVRSR